MAIIVGSFEAKNQLSELLRKVQAGEEVIITRHNQPLARLVAWEERADPKGIIKAFSMMKQLREGAGNSQKSGDTPSPRNSRETR